MFSFSEPETWVLVAFILFVALLIYLKAPSRLTAMLDERTERIARELAEARKLREEAQALLAEYQGKRMEAEKTASDIIAQAKREAEAYASEAREKLTETIARRTRQAEQKIAQAEQQAVKDVRSTVTDLAIGAASELLGTAVKGDKGDPLIEQSIGAVKSRLH
jgi:F-type H+-transporting ATPase subunit b